MRMRKTLYYVIDIDQFHAPNAKLKIRQYLILPNFRQNRQIFCTPIFLRLQYYQGSTLIFLRYSVHMLSFRQVANELL